MTTVRVVETADVPGLGPALGAAPDVYPSHFDMQEEGAAVLFVAEDDGRPVGAGLLRWQARDDVVRTAFPGLPELSNLYVPDVDHGRGHGTALIEAIAAHAAAAGHRRIGLGVDDGNSAAALYLRLGWAETGLRYVDRYTWTDVDGGARDETEPVRYLLRDLGAQP